MQSRRADGGEGSRMVPLRDSAVPFDIFSLTRAPRFRSHVDVGVNQSRAVRFSCCYYYYYYYRYYYYYHHRLRLRRWIRSVMPERGYTRIRSANGDAERWFSLRTHGGVASRRETRSRARVPYPYTTILALSYIVLSLPGSSPCPSRRHPIPVVRAMAREPSGQKRPTG